MNEYEIRKISWLLIAKKLVKFEGDEKKYPLSDNVIATSDFLKSPIIKNDSVEVDIKDGQVIYLKKATPSTAKTEEPKVEAPEATPEVKKEEPIVKEPEPPVATPPEAKSEGSIQQEFTIFAVSGDKKFIKFTEIKDQGWFATSDEIRSRDYVKEGIVARNKAIITVQDKNLIAIATLAPQQTTQEAPSEVKTAETVQATPEAPKQAPVAQQTAKKEWKPTYNAQTKDDYWTKKAEHDKEHFDVKESEKQLSIEVQCAVGQACNLVGQVAASISPAPTANVINSMVEVIAKANFELIQSLKKK